jgi:thiol-disulfide isomerase/thioredoxin
MLERLLILLLVALAVAAGWGVLQVWKHQRLRALQASPAAQSPLRDVVPPGRPAVVAFTAPHCSDCRTRQAPALERLKRTVGDRVAVRTLSALDHPELVDQLGILTVPATAVVDSAGSVRHLNLGYASDAKLQSQLSEC